MATSGTDVDDVNEVRLRGRLAAPPQQRELPSGDAIVVCRLVVARVGAPTGRVRIDTIDVVARRAAIRRRLSAASPGEVLEVTGPLRRRFWRGPQGPASRYEVEADSLVRVARAPRP
jgi:single-strand DNA-binding protein